MAQKFPYERASTILAESEIFGDKKTCERWGITNRTLLNYRYRANEDPNLSQSFQLKKRMLSFGWQQNCASSLNKALKTFDELVEEAKVKIEDTPEKIEGYCAVFRAVVGGIKIVGELKLSGEALNESSDSAEISAFEARTR